MRLFMVMILLVSSSAFAQRVKENIKQAVVQSGPQDPSKDFPTDLNPKPAEDKSKSKK